MSEPIHKSIASAMQSVTKKRGISPTKLFLGFLNFVTLVSTTAGQNLTATSIPGGFPIVKDATPTPIYVDAGDYAGVNRAAIDLQHDIQSVSGKTPVIYPELRSSEPSAIILGTIGHNTLLDKLIQAKKINVDSLRGQWENYLIQVVREPFPGIKQALVIAGSDKRGTIFGIYTLSKAIGVSPWHWWADVPPKKSAQLFINAETVIVDKPQVKYRGIFLNDEEPALGRWAVEKYGGFNHSFYEKLFELILRLKGNYLWPAMWWASFNSDDPLNPKLADEYGIVMGTTHHEPMMRAHAEWKKANGGEWNYETNEAKLDQFWREGITRMNGYESIVTLAMRGDGDMAMTAETNTRLLERIVKNQRSIIHDVTGKDPQDIPQLWALYKEVQDYYDKGMRVPDDVLLLLCDDNWGNIRKLPKIGEPPRKGGYGIYYHFDYVGGPRNYKWINTNTIARTWEQMNLAYQYGADRLWLVNVGDLKPIEFPTSFFLDFAWNPKGIRASDLESYTQQWVENQFGFNHAAEIAALLTAYSKFNARRKPELLTAETYSIINYREAETVVNDYMQLQHQAEKLKLELPSAYQDAYFQLILFPIKASANLNKMYLMQAKNKYYAKQNRVSASNYADSVKFLFRQDSIYANYYNKILLNGKWNHMMDQTHISYTNWQQPEKDVVPETVNVNVTNDAAIGVQAEGEDKWWPKDNELSLPSFDPYNNQTYFVDVFPIGKHTTSIAIKTDTKWIRVDKRKINISQDQRLLFNIDWAHVAAGHHSGTIFIQAGKTTIPVKVNVTNEKQLPTTSCFLESNGYVSIESVHFTKANNANGITWLSIANLGKTLGGVTLSPAAFPTQTVNENAASLEYTIHSTTAGECTLHAYVSPSIDFHNNGGLRFAVSIDDEPPQIINLHADTSLAAWEKSVSDNIIVCSSKHNVKSAGLHTIKYWAVDAGVVLQKLVLDLGELKPSYLGPPESYLHKKITP